MVQKTGVSLKFFLKNFKLRALFLKKSNAIVFFEIKKYLFLAFFFGTKKNNICFFHQN